MSAPFRGLIYRKPEAAPEQHLSRAAIYGLLVTAVVALGLNWPVMATALESITPIWMAWLRVAVAGIAVTVGGAVTKTLRIPPRSDLPMIVSRLVG